MVSHYQSLGAGRSHGHQVVNFFHFVGVLASVKRTQEMCTRYHSLGTSERSHSRGCGAGSVPGRPRRVLLGYTTFLNCGSSPLWPPL